MRIFNYLLICLMLVAGFSQSAWAQTAPLEEKQKAVLLFDVRLDRLQESDLAKKFGLKEMMQQRSASADIDFSKAIRVFGIMSSPESIEEIQGISDGGDLPMEFAMRVQFADAGAMNDVIKKAKTESTEFTQGGKTYYRPKDENAPKNICMGQFDSTTIVMGTDAYVFLPDQKVAFTSGLQTAWASVNKVDDTVRIVVDMVGAKELIDQALEEADETAPPEVKGYLELIPGMNDLRITMDLSGGNLLTLGSTCKDSECATNLNDGLASIFGIAKLGAESQVGQMKQMGMESVANVMTQILEALQPKLEGSSVLVAVPKPEGFEDAVQQAAGMIGPLMMGGGGPGGPPQDLAPPDSEESDGGGF